MTRLQQAYDGQSHQMIRLQHAYGGQSSATNDYYWHTDDTDSTDFHGLLCVNLIYLMENKIANA